MLFLAVFNNGLLKCARLFVAFDDFHFFKFLNELVTVIDVKLLKNSDVVKQGTCVITQAIVDMKGLCWE